MMVTYLIIGFVLISVMLIGIAVYLHRTAKDKIAKASVCQTDSDCTNGQRCVVNPSDTRMNVCAEAHMKHCVFSDFTKLTSCDPQNPTSCKECVNRPEFACVVVNYGKPRLITNGRNYTTGLYRAVLFDPGANQYNFDRDMQVSIVVNDSANGIVDSVTIIDPVQVYKKDDIFAITGGNNDAVFQLTEEPTPYFWQKGTSRINLPESETGGWCLPPVDRTTNPCNPYTSDNVLVQSVDAQGKPTYTWGCYCKIPSLMQHDDTPNSNCGTLVGCAGYDMYIPPRAGETEQMCRTNTECPPDSKCCTDEKCLKSTETFPNGVGKCYTRWTNTTLDRNPRNGTCDCPSNTYYLNSKIGDYVVKTCNNDQCQPGGSKAAGTQLCNCKPGYVSCGVTPSVNVKVTDARCSSTTTSNRCIPDPCAPGGTMRQGGGCNCDNSKGYYEKNNSSVIGGKVCTQLCVDNGPCGARGTCVIEKGEEKCKDCVCPWVASQDGLCNTNSGKQSIEGGNCAYTSRWEGNFITGRKEIREPVADSCCTPLRCENPGPVCRR